jgi:predicted RNA-binding protein with PUA-like domain
VNHWLVKSEPEAYSFEQLRRDKTTAWTGVRNYTARNFLRAMKKGDAVFFYHSMTDKAIVGLATVSKEAFPDPTVESGEKGDWSCVELKAGKALPKSVTLEQVKATPALKTMALLKQSRLSVQPVSAAEAAVVRRLAGLISVG